MTPGTKEHVRECIKSLKILFEEATEATTMQARVDALDGMEHDLRQLNKTIELMQEDCYNEDGSLKTVE